MKTIKYIGQLLASLVYTPIYICILFAVIIIPFAWLTSLSSKWIIITIVFLGGLIEGLIFLVKFLGFIPYSWILKDNKCAVWISAAISTLITIRSLYVMWSTFPNYGTMGFITGVIVTALLLQAVIMSVILMFSVAYDD